jgi:Flp pilus assembly CpaF family ATPase
MTDLTALNRLYGIIFEDYLNDPAVTDFHVQPPAYGEKKCLRGIRKRGVMTEVGSVGVDDVLTFLSRLATYNGKEFGEEKPRLNARLPTGQRLHANFERMTSGPTFSVRQPSREIITLDMLTKWEMISATEADFLRGCLADGDNILISGNPGAGKTTLLRALCHEETIRNGRSLIVQDPNEFEIPGKWILHLEADEDGEYPVSIADCIADALRKDTESLIIGEVRTRKAAEEMVTGYNTVTRTIGTIHAKSAHHAPGRVANLTKADEHGRHELAELINVVVHCARIHRTDARRVETIARVEGYADNAFQIA